MFFLLSRHGFVVPQHAQLLQEYSRMSLRQIFRWKHLSDLFSCGQASIRSSPYTIAIDSRDLFCTFRFTFLFPCERKFSGVRCRGLGNQQIGTQVRIKKLGTQSQIQIAILPRRKNLIRFIFHKPKESVVRLRLISEQVFPKPA